MVRLSFVLQVAGLVWAATIVSVLSALGDASYVVPEPQVEVSTTRGFKVSIPDDDGVQLFAFHGNVNRPIGHLESGEFSVDIVRKDEHGRWTFRNSYTKLAHGDKIHYWLYVLKHGLGYRRDIDVFEVKESTETGRNETRVPDAAQFPFPAVQSESLPADGLASECGPVRRPGDSPAPGGPSAEDVCGRILQNMTEVMVKQRREVDLLREENGILRDIAEKETAVWRRLRVEGRLPPDADPLQTVRSVIREKLRLQTVGVVSATRDPAGGITFEVARLQDKLDIIRAAKGGLLNSVIHITY